jgi:hypothetical protein
MKSNKNREIVKCIDSMIDLMSCAECERLHLAEDLGIVIIEQPPTLHIANERELTEIAIAYKANMVYAPRRSEQFPQEASITVNGVKLYTLVQ